MRRPSRQTLIAVMLAAAWGAALGVMHLSGRFPAIDGAEATLANFRTVLRGPRRPPDIVTIVAIDDATVDEAGGYPLPRAALASIVDTVAKLRPKALALDLLLVDRGPEAGDMALADALRLGRSVIAAAAVFPESLQELSAAGGDPMSSLPNARELLLPQRRFTDVAAIGVVNVETDKAGTPRFAPMLFRSGARLEPSFPLSVASGGDGGRARYRARSRRHRRPQDTDRHRLSAATLLLRTARQHFRSECGRCAEGKPAGRQDQGSCGGDRGNRHRRWRRLSDAV